MPTPTITDRQTQTNSNGFNIIQTGDRRTVHVVLIYQAFDNESPGTITEVTPNGWVLRQGAYATSSAQACGIWAVTEGDLQDAGGGFGTNFFGFSSVGNESFMGKYFTLSNVAGASTFRSSKAGPTDNQSSLTVAQAANADDAYFAVHGTGSTKENITQLSARGATPPQNEENYTTAAFFDSGIFMWDNREVASTAGSRHQTSGTQKKVAAAIVFKYESWGLSVGRDGIAGADIKGVDNIVMGNVKAIDGVTAMTESGILISNDPRYMRKAA